MIRDATDAESRKQVKQFQCARVGHYLVLG